VQELKNLQFSIDSHAFGCAYA